MARFDVFRTLGSSLVIDYQSDMLAYLQTRFVIPLMPPEVEPPQSKRLNPAFMVGGQQYVLYPQFAASVAEQELQTYVMSLADQHLAIIDAFDMLTSGY
ncbi:MAG: hypothetical protein RLZZ58_554 [Pseudomonadota bacterium]|jgi:toxin CcdB